MRERKKMKVLHVAGPNLDAAEGCLAASVSRIITSHTSFVLRSNHSSANRVGARTTRPAREWTSGDDGGSVSSMGRAAGRRGAPGACRAGGCAGTGFGMAGAATAAGWAGAGAGSGCWATAGWCCGACKGGCACSTNTCTESGARDASGVGRAAAGWGCCLPATMREGAAA